MSSSSPLWLLSPLIISIISWGRCTPGSVLSTFMSMGIGSWPIVCVCVYFGNKVGLSGGKLHILAHKNKERNCDDIYPMHNNQTSYLTACLLKRNINFVSQQVATVM